MNKTMGLIAAAFFAMTMICAEPVQAQPVKWSAPMGYYPRQWTPTPPPAPRNYGYYGYNPYYGNTAPFSYGYSHPQAAVYNGLSGYYNHYYGY